MAASIIYVIFYIILATHIELYNAAEIEEQEKCFTMYSVFTGHSDSFPPIEVYNYSNFKPIPETVEFTLKCENRTDYVSIVGGNYSYPGKMGDFCMYKNNKCSITEPCQCCSKPSDSICSLPLQNYYQLCNKAQGNCTVNIPRKYFSKDDCSYIDYPCVDNKGTNRCISRWVYIYYKCTPEYVPPSERSDSSQGLSIYWIIIIVIVSVFLLIIVCVCICRIPTLKRKKRKESFRETSEADTKTVPLISIVRDENDARMVTTDDRPDPNEGYYAEIDQEQKRKKTDSTHESELNTAVKQRNSYENYPVEYSQVDKSHNQQNTNVKKADSINSHSGDNTATRPKMRSKPPAPPIPGSKQPVQRNEASVPGNKPLVPGNKPLVPGNKPLVPGNKPKAVVIPMEAGESNCDKGDTATKTKPRNSSVVIPKDASPPEKPPRTFLET